MSEKRVTLGCFEIVSFPLFGAVDIHAKVDTGAFSGAMDCTDIMVVRSKTSGKRILKFTPFGETAYATKTDQFHETYVRSAHGHRLRRYIIDTEIVVQGVTYPVKIGLSNRSEMKRPVLIGRRFIRENNMLVDVNVNKELDEEGNRTV
jgi:hypothetical protein